MAEMLNRILDVVMLVAIVISAIVSIDVAGDILPEDTRETVCASTTEPATGATTEPAQIPTETTEPATVPHTIPPETTEEPEPPVMLYDVPLSEDLQMYIIELCESKDINPAIVMAMIWRESSFRASVIGDNGKSFGLMQVQPKWCMEEMWMLGCMDLLDPYQNVMVGITILAEKLEWYDGDIAKAVTAYNAGHYKGVITDYAKDVLEKAEDLVSNGRYPDK